MSDKPQFVAVWSASRLEEIAGSSYPTSTNWWSLRTKRNHVGAGFPRPIASITYPGGENPPLRWIAWLRLILKDHQFVGHW